MNVSSQLFYGYSQCFEPVREISSYFCYQCFHGSDIDDFEFGQVNCARVWVPIVSDSFKDAEESNVGLACRSWGAHEHVTLVMECIREHSTLDWIEPLKPDEYTVHPFG